MMRVFLLLFCVGLSGGVQAFSWQDLWHTPDQQGRDYYQAGKHKQAERLFTRDDWRGMAAYRQGNYQEAGRLFAEEKGAPAYYNLGNSLAQQKKFQAALKAYQQALALAPNDKDTQFNRDLMKKLLEQQKKQPSSQNQSKKKSDKDQKKSQSQKNKSSSASKNDQAKKKQSQQDKNKQSQAKSSDKKDGEAKKQASRQADKKSSAEQRKQADKNSKKESSKQQASNERELKQLEKQWLRQIPSQPMGLLQQKFQRDYDKRHSKRRW